MAKVLAYLVEVEERQLHLQLAYSSMFDFCTRHLGLTENEAYRRIAAARLVRELPSILSAIALGSVTLTNVVLLRHLFTADNVESLLAEIAGKSRREVEVIVARLDPQPDVPDAMRQLSPQTGGRDSAVGRGQMKPLSEDRFCITFSGPESLCDKIERARALTRHTNPSGELATLFEAALDALIEKREKTQLGKTSSPRQARASSDPTYVSAATRREVSARDGDQCTFVGPDGTRCPAREWLELDHRQPRALGGAGDASNVRVLCALHNRYEVERAFGQEHVARRIDQSRARRRAISDASSGEMNHACPDPSQAKREALPNPSAEKRDTLRRALLGLGFRASQADGALIKMVGVDVWARPLEALLRDALGMLT